MSGGVIEPHHHCREHQTLNEPPDDLPVGSIQLIDSFEDYSGVFLLALGSDKSLDKRIFCVMPMIQ